MTNFFADLIGVYNRRKNFNNEELRKQRKSHKETENFRLKNGF